MCLGAPIGDPTGIASDCFAYTQDPLVGGALPIKRTLCSKPSYFICQMGELNFMLITTIPVISYSHEVLYLGLGKSGLISLNEHISSNRLSKLN